MKRAAITPQRQLFVCTNVRPAGDPLGPGCSHRGESVYTAFKSEVAARGLTARVWITRTHCLGICPARGATVADYPSGRISTEVEPADVPAFWQNEEPR